MTGKESTSKTLWRGTSCLHHELDIDVIDKPIKPFQSPQWLAKQPVGMKDNSSQGKCIVWEEILP